MARATRRPPKSTPATDAAAEQRFLAAYDPEAYPRPSLAVDLALIATSPGHLHTLLVRRDDFPFRGRWALPGGFMRLGESLEAAARRVLADKTGLHDIFVEQLYTFGAPDRDPRTRVVSVAYYALVDHQRFQQAAARSSAIVAARLVVPWEGETGGPIEVTDDDGRPLALAFDHADILGLAVKRLRGKLDYAPLGFQLLPPTFTLLDLQRVHETVLGRPLNKDSFRRRMLASQQLEATGESQKEAPHRPAELYRFARRSAL